MKGHHTPMQSDLDRSTLLNWGLERHKEGKSCDCNAIDNSDPEALDAYGRFRVSGCTYKGIEWLTGYFAGLDAASMVQEGK